MKNSLKLIIALLIFFALFIQSCNQNQAPKDKTQGLYFGQTPPGNTPELFAPGIVSTEMHEHSILAFSPDGKHALWSSQFLDNFGFPGKIISSEYKIGKWSTPDFFKEMPMSRFAAPSFSPDGNRIYFTSSDTAYGETKSFGSYDLWYINKTSDGWSKPINLGEKINSDKMEAYATQTESGTIYFLGESPTQSNVYIIFRSELKDGVYQTPEMLPKNINSEHLDWTPFIAPDESYLLFSSHRPGGYGNGDLYISFRIKGNEWTDPINLGPEINSDSQERFPSVSPDSKYLFFVTNKLDKILENDSIYSLEFYRKKQMQSGNSWNDFYWVKADVIQELKEKTQLK